MAASLDRRDFLRAAGGTLSLLLSRQGLSAAQMPVRDSPVGPAVTVGVIGLGAWGRDILSALGRIPAARVDWICDVYEPFLKRAAASAPRAQPTTEWRRLLDSPVEAVIVATPTHAHREIATAALQAVQVDAELFALLRRCRELSALTDGAFDVTVGPLMRAWRRAGSRGSPPDPAAPAPVGWQHLLLDDGSCTVAFGMRGMSLDLGAAGKGHAIHHAVEVLFEQGVGCALLHDGTSSVHATGISPEGTPWNIAWRPCAGGTKIFALAGSALSISGVPGRCFAAGGSEYGHIMDPRTGAPLATPGSAAVIGPRSLECDALSTALLVS